MDLKRIDADKIVEQLTKELERGIARLQMEASELIAAVKDAAKAHEHLPESTNALLAQSAAFFVGKFEVVSSNALYGEIDVRIGPYSSNVGRTAPGEIPDGKYRVLVAFIPIK